MNLADRVRSHCEEVCRDPKYVRFNRHRIASYAAEISTPANTQAIQTASSAELERQRLLVLGLDTINFGSGWHDVINKRPDLSGARSMSAALTEFEKEHGPLTPTVLSELDQSRCCELFGQDPENSESAELMAHFSTALQQLAALLANYGSATQLIDHSQSSAVRLAELLTNAPTFDDVGFFKRAQIAAADLARQGLADFDDLSDLTAFADNLVPHVLAVDGVITLTSDLAAQIARGDLLTPGSQQEIELRASAVQVVEMMTAERPDLRAMDIDEALWERGGQPHYKQFPRPRCRSLFY